MSCLSSIGKCLLAGALSLALAAAAIAAPPWWSMPGDSTITLAPSPSCREPVADGCNVWVGGGLPQKGFRRGAFNLFVGSGACPDFEEGDYNLCIGSGAVLPAKASHMLALPGRTVPLRDMTEADGRAVVRAMKDALERMGR